MDLLNIFNERNILSQIAGKHNNSALKPLLTKKLHEAFFLTLGLQPPSYEGAEVIPNGQMNQETPKLPYLRQPSGPQSVFYQKGKVEL